MDLQAIGAAAAQDAGGVDPELLAGFLPTVVDAAATGRRLRRRELDTFAEAGRRAAGAGVALRALVDLYLSAGWRLWRDAPEVSRGDAERVRAAGLALMRAMDDGLAALAEGFQLARADLARLQEAARHDVVDALLEGGEAAAAAVGRAAELGLVLAGPVAVLVAHREKGFDSPGTAALPGRIERSLTGRLGDARPLVMTRNRYLLCVFAAPDAASVDTAVARVDAQLQAQLGRADTWRVAVSTPRLGPEGVRTSHDEAMYALELADRLEMEERVVSAGDLTVYRVLLRDRPAAHDLVRSTLSPLTAARGGAEPLLQTLAAYYATGGVATRTAAHLNLSVRAVTYRLARVADLLGRDPSDPAERLTLQAAVTTARLLDWPRTPIDAG